MKVEKCPNCGASIHLENGAVACEYCGTKFKVKKQEPEKTSNTQTIINNYYSTPTSTPARQPIQKPAYKPRPKINFLVAIILLWFYVLPGLIYISSVRQKQRAWDAIYKK